MPARRSLATGGCGWSAVADSLRWLWALFGVLFGVSSIICFVNPESTFVALADTLGFLFLGVGLWWTIRAFPRKSRLEPPPAVAADACS